jgi:lipopolysaccharide transport system ATP-binding protein
MAIVEVNHVTKEFQLGQLQSLKLGLQRVIAKLNRQPLPQRQNFKALDDIDFKVEPGEVLGIIGNNGAGKSTLLKILSRITVPSSGNVRVHGRVAPLIEVGAGLVGDLTGRENIFLNAAILGMSKAEIRRKFDAIVEFSELEKFLDTPIKRYSSGMAVRLGFSIATSVESEILIVDEVLAVGDLAFQRKCFDRMEDLIKRQDKTVLLVSHNIRQVERLCTRAILLDRGRIVIDDVPRKACDMFYSRSDAQIKNTNERKLPLSGRLEQHGVELQKLAMIDSSGEETANVLHGSDFTVVVRLRISQELTLPTFGIGVHTTDLLYLTTHNSESDLHVDSLPPGDYELRWRVKDCPLLPGVYCFRLGVTTGAAAIAAFYGENLLTFQVLSGTKYLAAANRHGFFALEAHWAPPHRLDGAPGEFGLRLSANA